MREQLLKPKNKEKYRLRHKTKTQTVEPVFEIIKQVFGFRQFLTRGVETINNEWNLVTTAYILKLLFALKITQQYSNLSKDAHKN